MQHKEKKTKTIQLRVTPSLHKTVFKNTKKNEVSKRLCNYLEQTYNRYVQL